MSNKKHFWFTHISTACLIGMLSLCLHSPAAADETTDQYLAAQDRYFVGTRVFGPSTFKYDGFTGQVIMLFSQRPNDSKSSAFCFNGRVTDWWLRQDDNDPFQQFRVTTPVIIERVPDPADTTGGLNPLHFYLRAIGTGRVSQRGSVDVRMYPFGLTSGSDYVLGDGNWFFGWYDGDLVGNPNNPVDQSPIDHSGSIGFEEFSTLGVTSYSFGNGWRPYLKVGIDLLDRQREAIGSGPGLPGFGPHPREYSAVGLYEGLTVVPSRITDILSGPTSMVDFNNSTQDNFQFSLEMATGLPPPLSWAPVPGTTLSVVTTSQLRFTFPGLPDSKLFFRVQTSPAP